MTSMPFWEARAKAFAREMKEDPSVLIIGGYLNLPFNPPDGLAEQFPGRVLFTPISELAMGGIGVGAAMAGLRPIVTFSTASFMLYAWPQVVIEAPNVRYLSYGRISCPVVFHIMAGSRGDGGVQHEHTPQAMVMNVPGIKIFAPATPADVDGLVTAAIKDPDPVLFVDHILLGDVEGEVPNVPDSTLPRADVLRSGKDVGIIAYSLMAHRALEAAHHLAGAGIDAGVLNLRTLVPMPMSDVLEFARGLRFVVIVDESRRAGSPASYLASTIAESLPDTRIALVCTLDAPFPFARAQRDFLLPTAEKIARASKNLMQLRAGARSD